MNKPTFFGYKVGYGDGAMNVDYVYETLPAFNAAFESTSDVLSKVLSYESTLYEGTFVPSYESTFVPSYESTFESTKVLSYSTFF